MGIHGNMDHYIFFFLKGGERWRKKRHSKRNGRKTKMIIDITELTSNQKERLKGAIKFFSGDKVNMRLSIIEKTQEKPCGAIFLTEETLEQFKEIVGEKNILLK